MALKNKMFVSLIYLGLSGISYATNPSDNCSFRKDSADHCQDGNIITAVGLCGLLGAGSSRAYPAGAISIGPWTPACRIDLLGGYACSAFDGIWEQGPQWIGHNEYTCKGPRYNFDIANKTSYAIQAVYFDAPKANDSSPDHTGYIVTNHAVSGEILHTNPDITSNDRALVVDTDYGEGHLGTVGTLAIYSPDINDGHSDYGIALATIQQHDPQGKHGEGQRYKYDLSSSTKNSGRPTTCDKPIHQVACVLTPDSDNRYATYDNNSGGIKSPPGKSVLLPNFIEARIDFCTNYSTSSHSESIPYTYSVAGFNDLNTTDTKLVPTIEATSGYISNPEGFQGLIVYQPNEAGEKCIPYNFVIKTKSTNCSSFENNLPQSGIDTAFIDVSVSTPNAALAYVKLNFNSQVTKTDDDVIASYTMSLDQNDPAKAFTINGSLTGSISCEKGICRAKLIYNK